MYINQAIRSLMKSKNISLLSMAKSLGKQRGNEISSRLRSENMSFNSAVEMLNVLGYEIVIQERKSGVRRADQIVIDQADERKYDLAVLLETNEGQDTKITSIGKSGKIQLR